MEPAGQARVERRLAAILAADVAGYSRLIEADEEGTLGRLKALRVEVIDPKIAGHHGRIVKTTGDGLLVEFASVVDALRCAAEMQAALAEGNDALPPDRRIEFRIGINVGDIVVEDGDIFGDGVNIAARLEALASPGGICVSRVVRDQVRDKLALSLEDMGEQRVKNIARPLHAYAVRPDTAAPAPVVAAPAPAGSARRGIDPRPAILAAGLLAIVGIAVAGWWAWPKGGSTAAIQAPAASIPQASPSPATAGDQTTQAVAAPLLSFVVLPFANLSNDPDQEYFVDAITEDLTTDLSRIFDSFVIARNTAFS